MSSRDGRAAGEFALSGLGHTAKREHLVTLEVDGRPASYSTAATEPWKTAVREAMRASAVAPLPEARFSVRIEFRTRVPKSPNERWDIDNLVKPTLDALEGMFGLRQWNGAAQAADDRVDHLEAIKRQVLDGEPSGATIDIWAIE